MSVGDGEMMLESFADTHIEILDGDPEAIAELLRLLAGAFSQLHTDPG